MKKRIEAKTKAKAVKPAVRRSMTATAVMVPAPSLTGSPESFTPDPERADGLVDYSTVKDLGPRFPYWVAEYARLGEQRKSLEERLGVLKDSLLEDLMAADEDEVGCGPYKVQRVVSKRSTVDPRQLVLIGVDPELVKRATRVTESVYVTVRKAEKAEEA